MDDKPRWITLISPVGKTYPLPDDFIERCSARGKVTGYWHVLAGKLLERNSASYRIRLQVLVTTKALVDQRETGRQQLFTLYRRNRVARAATGNSPS